MAYLGKTPSQAVRQRYYYTASGGETSLSGADDNGNTLIYTDGAYVDVFLNGILLVSGTDYNTTTANTIGGLTALSASDVVEIVVYDTFAVFGGEVQGDMTVTNGALKTTDITAVDSNGIQFNTDEGTERARIDDSGNLLVGKTASNLSAAGVQAQADGALFATRTGDSVVWFNKLSADGNIVRFQKDGTSVGAIGVNSSYMYIGDINGTLGAGLHFVNGAVRPFDAKDNLASDAGIELGRPTNRFLNLYLSGGVYLGGTGSANFLDDYEEGTWTPTYLGTASDPTITYDAFTAGYYTKVGRQVTITGTIRTDAVSGGSGALRVGNLPFASVDNSVGTKRDADFNGVVAADSGWTNGTAPMTISLFSARSEANLRRRNDPDNIDIYSDVTDLTSGGNQNRLSFTLTYFTA